MDHKQPEDATAANQQGREARQAAGPPWEHEPDPEQKCCCKSHDASECAWIRDGRPIAKGQVTEPCECACHRRYREDE